MFSAVTVQLKGEFSKSDGPMDSDVEPESARGRRSLAESRMGSSCHHQVLSRSGSGGRQGKEETLGIRHMPGSRQVLT